MAILVFGTLAQLWRLGMPRAFDTMWAEDGRKFYEESWEGLWPTLAEPYSGYLHTVPRIWAWFASQLPIGLAPAIIAVGASVTVAGIAAYAYVTSRSYIRQPVLRLLLAAFIILVPLARYEAVANLTNLHWYLLAGLTLAALADQGQLVVRVASVILVLGATTSDGLAILLAPVFIGLWWVDRSRGRTTVLIAYLLGSALHLVAMLVDRGMGDLPYDNGRLDFLLLPGVYVTRVIAPAIIGEPTVQRSFTTGLDVGSLGIVVLSTTLIGLMVGYVLLRPAFPQRRAAMILITYSGVFFGAPMKVHGDIDRFAGTGDDYAIFTGTRYFIAPSILLVAALLTTFSERDPRVPMWLWRLITGVISAAIALSLAVEFAIEPPIREYPSWDEQIDALVTYCNENPGLSEPATIGIQPPGWEVRVNCEDLGTRR